MIDFDVFARVSLNTKHQIYFFGGYSEEATPVSIPNTEVKLFSADGTAWATVWESRTPPDFFLNPEPVMVSGFFISFHSEMALFPMSCVLRVI